jgi:hypothetical protein
MQRRIVSLWIFKATAAEEIDRYSSVISVSRSSTKTLIPLVVILNSLHAAFAAILIFLLISSDLFY